MTRAIIGILTGLGLAIFMGREALTAYQMDSAPIRITTRARVARKQSPKRFWFYVVFGAFCAMLGLGVAGLAIADLVDHFRN